MGNKIRIGEDNKARMEHTFISSECDAFQTVTLDTYESLMQEVAALHSSARKCGLPDLMERGLTWVIARNRMTISRYAGWTDDCVVTTWAQDSPGFNCPRRVEGALSDGTPLFTCQTRWAVVNLKTGRPQRASEVNGIIVTPAPELQGDFNMPPVVDEDTASQVVLLRHIPRARYTDTDMNKHINNRSYINWCLEAVPQTFLDAKLPRLVDVRWMRQCHKNDNLEVVARASDREELSAERPRIWFDIWRTEDSGARTKVFDAWTEWAPREEIAPRNQ